MPEPNVKEILEQIPAHFNPELARDVNARVQFNLTGEQGSNWGLIIKDQTCSVQQGEIENPNLTLKADAVLATRILSGEEDGMRAFMMGKLKLKGNLSLAMKLVNFFK